MLILSILIVNWWIWIIKLHLWYFVTFGVAYYPVSETMVFTICKKFLENLVGKKMEHDFLGRSGGLFWCNGTSEKVILFFEFHFLKAVFDTSFRRSQPFFGRWSWFVHWYGKRHFSISEFCLPFTQTVNRPVCPCKWLTTYINHGSGSFPTFYAIISISLILIFILRIVWHFSHNDGVNQVMNHNFKIQSIN